MSESPGLADNAQSTHRRRVSLDPMSPMAQECRSVHQRHTIRHHIPLSRLRPSGPEPQASLGIPDLEHILRAGGASRRRAEHADGHRSVAAGSAGAAPSRRCWRECLRSARPHQPPQPSYVRRAVPACRNRGQQAATDLHSSGATTWGTRVHGIHTKGLEVDCEGV